MVRPSLALSLSLLALAACSESPPASETPDAKALDDVARVDTSLDIVTYDITPRDIVTHDTGGDAELDATVDGDLDASIDAALDVAFDAAPDVPPACPLYQTRCGGVCIPTSGDPANCGGCGVRCGADQVCSGGTCASSCLTGLRACSGRCVDVQSDNANCGTCGAACPTGQGCVAGACRRLMLLDPTAVACSDAGGSGPLLDLGGGRCAGAVAETSFRWAICACRSVSISGRLVTDGFDSSRGAYTPGGLGAGVGTNGTFSCSDTTAVGGALWIGNAGPWGNSSPYTVQQVLRINGDYGGSGTLTARDEAYVNGAVRTSSTVAVTGALHLPVGAMIEGDVTARRLAREAVTVTPPCDCSAESRVPVASFISEARTRNDNARLGLDPGALMAISTPARLDLPCGRYYLRGISSAAPVTIVAHGRTALFIDGDIAQGAALTITLDPTAELDVVLGGRFGVSGALTLGSPSYPALMRVYVASTEGFSLTSGASVAANLYLPDGRLGTAGPLEVYGGLVVGELSSSSPVTIHYDRAVLRVGDPCHPPPVAPPPDAGTAPDASMPTDAARPDSGTTPMCTSCRDCANQACVGGRCGACRTDADCCAPLQCWMGQCVVIPG